MANLGKAPQLNTNDRIINQLQANIVGPLNKVLGLPILQGIILSDIDVVSGDNTINHLLGRALVGWIVILQNAAVSIYDKQSSNTDTANTLILNSSGTATISLYVF